MKKRKKSQKSPLLKVLETMCGILFGFALMLLIWDIRLKAKNPAEQTSALAENTASTTVTMTITPTPNLRIDQNATEEKPAEAAEPERNVAIPGYKTMNFAADTETVSVDLYNPEKNTGYYYLTFEIRVPDSTGNYETLYTSDLVEGGKHLYQITLSHALTAGVYERCILHVQPYTVNELTPTNNADVEFTLNVN